MLTKKKIFNKTTKISVMTDKHYILNLYNIPIMNI